MLLAITIFPDAIATHTAYIPLLLTFALSFHNMAFLCTNQLILLLPLFNAFPLFFCVHYVNTQQ